MRVQSPCLPALALTLALAGCGDQPTASPPPADPSTPAPLAQIACTADVRAGTLSCEAATGLAAGGARASQLTVGGQNHYVRLTSSKTSSNAGVLTSTVTVENLLTTAMGTADGHTPASTGVEVFFATGPTNGVTVVNPTGYGTYTAANQPFFRYANQALGADSILSPDETSSGLTWQFAGNGASTFSFVVYVQTQISAPYRVHFDRLAAEFHACGLNAAGTAYCWGSNVDGQLGIGSLAMRPEVPSPVVMPAGVHFTAIHQSERHACALGTNGRAYCWGATQYGVLGAGPTTDSRGTRPGGVVMPAGVSFVEIAAGGLEVSTYYPSGHGHSCALSAGGIAYCWGSNQYTKLGVGDPDTASFRNVPTQVVMPPGVTFSGLDSGWLHICALGSDGKAYCWGHGGNGALGTGEKGVDHAAPAAVSMPAGVTFTAISAGAEFTCALGNDLNAYCWGLNLGYNLGIGFNSELQQPTPAKVKLPAGVVFAEISVGSSHACGLSTTGMAYCWGSDDHGELGNGPGYKQNVPGPVTMPAGVVFTHITAGYYRTCATSAGYAYCWGKTGAAVSPQVPVPVVATY